MIGVTSPTLGKGNVQTCGGGSVRYYVIGSDFVRFGLLDKGNVQMCGSSFVLMSDLVSYDVPLCVMVAMLWC